MKERYQYLAKKLRKYSFKYLKASDAPIELLDRLKDARPEMIMDSKSLDLLASAIVYYHVREEGLGGRGGLTKKSIAIYFDVKEQSVTQKTFDVSSYLDERHLGKDEPIEFIDKDRFKVNEMYWDFLDSDIVNDPKKSIKKLKEIIKKDPDFFDPYVTLHEYYFSEERTQDAFAILSIGYDRAMKLISKTGRFPTEMLWGFTENRHIMRVMFAYATLVWLVDDKKQALDIMLMLLHLNPNDNIGARYYIVALLENFDCAEDVDEMFEEKFGMDAIKIEKWFHEKAQKHQDVLGWWFDLEDE
jgi:tetratricopeptide (TPR) repeat protein